MEEIETSSRKTTIIAAGVVIIVLAVILITGRKSINVVNGVNGYSDENSIYNQANLILGEEQVYGGAGKIITEVANDGQIYNVAFNVSTQKFDMACSKPGCVHNKSDCISRIDMICAQNIGEDIYYIPSDNKTNIWKSVTGFKGEKLDEDFQGPAVSYTTKTSDGDYSIITVDWNTMKGYATLYKTILTSEELNACYSDSGSLNNLGSREELGTYYFEASDTDELNKVFKEYCE